MKKKKSREIYIKRSFFLILLLGLVSFVIGFINNFSVDRTLSAYFEKQLRTNLPCPVKYSEMKVLYFPLGIQLQKVNIPSSCIPQLQESLLLDSVDIRVSLLSLVTFSPSLSFEIENNQILSLYGDTELDKNDISIQFQQSKINAKWLNRILVQLYRDSLPFTWQASGEINFKLSLQTKKKKIQKFDLDLRLENFDITNIDFPGMSSLPIRIGKMAIVVETNPKNQKLNFKKISLGSRKHSLMADFTGSLELSQDHFKKSPLKAQGKLWLSKNLLEIQAISLAKIYLNKFYKKEDDFYHLSLSNTLGDPRIQ